jgi:putative phage-type endonuclease
MRIVNMTQGDDTWLEWRTTGIGSSDIAAIMGKSPFKTPLDVYYEKSCIGKTKDMTAAMCRGKMYEEEARLKFSKKMREEFLPCCCEMEDKPYFIASLDGYSKEGNAILEIKIPGRKVLELAKQVKIPEQYEIQMQWQMMVANVCYAYFCCYAPETGELYVVEIMEDPDLQDVLANAAEKFWSDFSHAIPPPEQKGDKNKNIMLVYDDRFKSLAAMYILLKEEIKEREEALKEIKQQILSYSADGNFGGYGISVVKTKARETYDIDAMKRDGINLQKYMKKSPEEENYQIRVNT